MFFFNAYYTIRSKKIRKKSCHICLTLFFLKKSLNDRIKRSKKRNDMVWKIVHTKIKDSYTVCYLFKINKPRQIKTRTRISIMDFKNSRTRAKTSDKKYSMKVPLSSNRNFMEYFLIAYFFCEIFMRFRRNFLHGILNKIFFSYILIELS